MNWISTMDRRQPEMGKGVLVYLKSGFITVAYKKRREEPNVTVWQLFGDTEGIIDEKDKITHWMPLPEPPK